MYHALRSWGHKEGLIDDSAIHPNSIYFSPYMNFGKDLSQPRTDELSVFEPARFTLAGALLPARVVFGCGGVVASPVNAVSTSDAAAAREGEGAPINVAAGGAAS